MFSLYVSYLPFSQNINEGIDDEQLRLAPLSLLESVPNLGLIVDLTNTNRYYNPQVSATAAPLCRSSHLINAPSCRPLRIKMWRIKSS